MMMKRKRRIVLLMHIVTILVIIFAASILSNRYSQPYMVGSMYISPTEKDTEYIVTAKYVGDGIFVTNDNIEYYVKEAVTRKPKIGGWYYVCYWDNATPNDPSDDTTDGYRKKFFQINLD